jgi:hypothetical protein
MAEAVRTESLDEFETAARASLGLAPDPSGDLIAPTPETPLPVQIRPLGRPLPFQGTIDGSGRSHWIVRTVGPDPSASERPWVEVLALLAVLAPVLAWQVAGRSTRPSRVGRPVLFAALALIAWWAGPAWLAAGSGFAALGRFTRD